MSKILRSPAVALVLSLCAVSGVSGSPAEAAVAKVSFEAIPRVQDTEAKPLKNLVFGMAGTVAGKERSSIARITSIRLKEMPQPGQDSLKLSWIITASNTRPITQRAAVWIHLLDAEEKTLRSAKGLILMVTGTKNKEFKVKMACELSDWQQTESLKIQVDWQN